MQETVHLNDISSITKPGCGGGTGRDGSTRHHTDIVQGLLLYIRRGGVFCTSLLMKAQSMVILFRYNAEFSRHTIGQDIS